MAAPPFLENYLSVINVQNSAYGAYGNGTHDDTAAIQLALNAVPNGPQPTTPIGGIVYFPRGTYLISAPLLRKVPFTHCVGEGKSATTILLDPNHWQGTPSPTDPQGSFIFDLQSAMVTDCTVTDLTINGSAMNLTQTDPTQSAFYSAILCSLRDEVLRVSLYDVWGFGLWIFGPDAAYTRVIDCDATLGLNPHALPHPTGGNDCIGGGALRSKIVRFYWMPGLAKNTALDFTAPGVAPGPSAKPAEVSVDVIDCINESPRDVVLEGCMQSTIRGSRFYGNNLTIRSDAFYGRHETIQNPLDILVANNDFVGQLNAQSQYVGGSCQVVLDGGMIYCQAKQLLNNGGRIAILGNSFINSAGGDPAKTGWAIVWAGDDKSNSDGGSIIADNRIVNPNPNAVSSTANLKSGCGIVSMGDAEGCGIAVLSSYGLTISDNTINDTNPSASQKMRYSMQLFSATGLPAGATMQRIIVEHNLCGSASGVGNGSVATFYYNQNEDDLLPKPILRRNTNQQSGYDQQASNEISGLASGTQWPLAGGYPYDAIVYVHGATRVDIDGSDTELLLGGFYLPAGHHITIHWTSAPTARVFR